MELSVCRAQGRDAEDGHAHAADARHREVQRARQDRRQLGQPGHRAVLQRVH